MINTKHFVLLAGDPEGYDREILAASQMSDFNLTAIQEKQYEEGRRSVQLRRTPEGWALHFVSSLNPLFVLLGPTSLEDALEQGIQWAKQDPQNREFYVTRELFDKHEALHPYYQRYCL